MIGKKHPRFFQADQKKTPFVGNHDDCAFYQVWLVFWAQLQESGQAVPSMLRAPVSLFLSSRDTEDDFVWNQEQRITLNKLKGVTKGVYTEKV